TKRPTGGGKTGGDRGMGGIGGRNSVRSIDRDFHTRRGVDHRFTFQKIPTNQPIGEAQYQFGSRSEFDASQPSQIDERAAPLGASDGDPAFSKYRRPGNGPFIVNCYRARHYQLANLLCVSVRFRISTFRMFSGKG